MKVVFLILKAIKNKLNRFSLKSELRQIYRIYYNIFYKPSSKELIIRHDNISGLFSCCSVKLSLIITFFNQHQRCPKSIYYRQLFNAYKHHHQYKDLNNIYFKEKNLKIKYLHKVNFHRSRQYTPYKELPFEDINPFMDKYFTPSRSIQKLVNQHIQKYNITPNKVVGALYRGTDKITEIGIGSYETFFEQAQNILSKDSTIRFLVQTEELEFRNEFIKRFPNSFYLDELPVVHKGHNDQLIRNRIVEKQHRESFSKLFLSAIILLSKCNYVVTNSSNCGLWIVLYRGHAKNVYQYINHINYPSQWIIS